MYPHSIIMSLEYFGPIHVWSINDISRLLWLITVNLNHLLILSFHNLIMYSSSNKLLFVCFFSNFVAHSISKVKFDLSDQSSFQTTFDYSFKKVTNCKMCNLYYVNYRFLTIFSVTHCCLFTRSKEV